MTGAEEERSGEFVVILREVGRGRESLSSVEVYVEAVAMVEVALSARDGDFEVQENPCRRMTDRGRMPELTTAHNKSIAVIFAPLRLLLTRALLMPFVPAFHVHLRCASTVDYGIKAS